MHDNIDKNDSLEDLENAEKRSKYLIAVRQSIQDHGGRYNEDILTLIDVLSQVLCDQYPSNRKLAMDLLCELIPSYEGGDLDSNMGMLFPQLLQNLLHHQLIVKKSVLQVLHVYYRHTKNIAQGLTHLIEHGILSDIKAVRNEVLVSIPALMSTGFDPKHVEKLIVSILNCLNTIENGDSILPITLCLEHLKNIIGDNQFNLLLENLDSNLVFMYQKSIENSSYTWETKENYHNRPAKLNTSLSDFIPSEILENLAPEKSWQTRSDAINELFNFVSGTMDENSLRYFCRKILDYISILVDDSNFNVALISMNILHQIVLKAGDQTKVHLDLVIKILLKKLNDSKLIMRKINLRIALSLMHALSPTIYLKSILPLLKHKSSRVREEIINMIIASLLSFPSSEFDLVTLPEIIGFTLLDNRKRVRHASLECFAILAQQLGPGNLSPLVSAVDILERRNKNADGLLLAVQSRLGRKMLPKINENELVQYAVKLPTSKAADGHLKPDVAWIVAGANQSGYETCRSEVSDYNDNNDKRILSAGRNKLPWQYNIDTKIQRKNAGSAPVRSSSLNHSRSPEPSPVICDSWVSEELLMHDKKNIADSSNNIPGSYFELYKNKMKKLKEAGLRADVQTVNMEVSSSEKHPYYREGAISQDEGNLSDQEPKTSPVPVKPTLARSASKRRVDKMFDRKNDNIPIKDELNDANYLAHTLPKMKGGLLQMVSTNFTTASPFPSRPTIHRTPSGTVSSRTSPRHHLGESSNLTRLKSLSHSSPAIVDDVLTYPYTHNINNTESRSKEEPINLHRQFKNINYDRGAFSNKTEHIDVVKNHENHEDNQPGTPKLAKSAQEKLRKFKEEQQRLSANSNRSKNNDHSTYNEPYNRINIEFNDAEYSNNNSMHEKRDVHLSNPSPRLNKNRNERKQASKNVKTFVDNNDYFDAVDSAQPLNPDDRQINPDDRPINPSKQTWAERDVQNDPKETMNNGGDMIVEGHKQVVEKIQPKKGFSPKLRRKASRKSAEPILNNFEGKENIPETKTQHSNGGEMDLANTKPYEALSMAMNMLDSSAEDWELKCDGVALLRRILKDQGESICDYHAVVSAILNQVRNLRSQVTRNALNCIGDVFIYTPKLVEVELEAILKTILPKSGDTNQFIRSDTEQAVDALTENVNPAKAIPAIITVGVQHLNGNVRKLSAKALADLTEKVGYVKFCQQKMNVSMAAKLATDKDPETRYHGRRILYILLEHPELQEMLRRQLNTANFKAVNGIVENLKSRGLEPASGSATLRKSMRGSARFNSPQSTRKSRKR